MEIAIFGGGCFWCLEAALRQLKGVQSVISGYCGGDVDHPNYAQVCSGNTGHAEVVKVTFDPAIIDYSTLLQAFFAIHDPTTPNRQGGDVGTQYRSVIFAQNADQERQAAAMIADLDRQGIWPAPIVTELRATQPFWPAENEHQDYLANHPTQPYCQAVVAPKAAKLRQLFKNRLH